MAVLRVLRVLLGESNPRADQSSDEPDGRIVWKHAALLEKAQLEAVLTEHTGMAALHR